MKQSELIFEAERAIINVLRLRRHDILNRLIDVIEYPEVNELAQRIMDLDHLENGKVSFEADYSAWVH